MTELDSGKLERYHFGHKWLWMPVKGIWIFPVGSREPISDSSLPRINNWQVVFLWWAEGYILLGEDSIMSLCHLIPVPTLFSVSHIHRSYWRKKHSGNIELSNSKERRKWKYNYTKLNYHQQIFLLLFKEDYPKPDFKDNCN